MKFPTFSAVPRAMLCAPSAALPQVGTSNVDMKRGTGRHAFVARAVNHGRDAALKEAAPEQLAEIEAIRLDKVVGFFAGCGPVSAELALAYDPETDSARVLGEDLGREYERAGADMSREVCGALDLSAQVMTDAEEGRVLDMKGKTAGDEWQLRIQTLALSRVLGLSRARTVFAYHQDDGDYRWGNVWEWDAFDLDGFAAEVRAMAKRVRAASELLEAGRVPDVYEGEHCHWCPAWRYCPAKTAMVRATDQSLQGLSAAVDALTMEQRAQAWRLVKQYKPIIEAVEKALKESAVLEPIDLGDNVVTALPGNESIDEPIGHAVLLEKYGIDVAVGSITRKLTKSGIERMLGPVEGARAVDLIRDAGGISEGAPTVKEIKKRKPAKRARAGGAQ